MSIRIALNHVTQYEYDRPVSLSPQIVRLRPAPHVRTPLHSFSMKIEPKDHFLNWQQDPYGNYLARLVFNGKTRIFRTEIDLVAEMKTINPFDFFLEPAAEEFPFAYDADSLHDLAPYLKTEEAGPLTEKLIAEIPREKMKTIDFMVLINRLVQSKVDYLIRMEPGVQSPEETLKKGSGSCRDSAWLLVNLARHVGLAARFVSGYLIQLKADQKSLDGPSGTEVDFTDLHAWTELYLPGAGWIGLDATSGLLAAEGHIPLACSPDPLGAAPITGAVDKSEVSFKHTMSVVRVHEDPRTTKPYTEEQWAAIDALGGRVDAILKRNDVRLTMGGEPTFISIDDMDGDEWNTGALSENKFRLAEELFGRLHRKFAPGGLKHYGMGKWYPGEPLPRWALGCYWRKDGEPIWHDDALVAKTNGKYGFGAPEAEKFAKRLAEKLAVNPEHAVPGYEDMFYYLWKERTLPVNVNPLKFKWKGDDDRARLGKLLDQGLEKVVGYVLPLSKGIDGLGEHWLSGEWPIRRGTMFLLPGDSPMGLRLPLDTLPWAEKGDLPVIEEEDPSVRREPFQRCDRPPESSAAPAPSTKPLGGRNHMDQKLYESEFIQRRLKESESASWILRTALCVEARGGIMHVFCPPVRKAEDYLDLMAAVEATAVDLKMPVRIEGYTPPRDSRIQNFKLTPDPGVIEVNVQPAADWREAERVTTILYEEAREARLGTEKFMLDGRHTGTGGGNHIVVGGAEPLDSPFLRRPDLLRSLVAYWHNHPALSYLFSGLFIGPTSQAPRPDEGRHDGLFELELAFSQIPHGTTLQPWVVDRLLRNLLVDMTGNTHRTEFCIDKLYSPDSASGRLGLVEIRSCEMPPHSRMSLAQQLLLRGLIARFWEMPYNQSLVRWGTSLHDRFMLPHYLWRDFEDVIDDLKREDHAYDAEWFAPHFEYRCPRVGVIEPKGIELEVRTALEPWHVLGEEGTPGGTARYVDSSLERVQVKVKGMTGSRHVVACNGRLLPLESTGVKEEYVAGVRYRAWQPPNCLQPLIGVHAPLTFDLIDTWNNLAIGGCTYHVSHPGGRSYDTFPVNALEAEARRSTRFVNHGHSPRPVKIQPAEINPEFPHTLDLRKYSI